MHRRLLLLQGRTSHLHLQALGDAGGQARLRRRNFGAAVSVPTPDGAATAVAASCKRRGFCHSRSSRCRLQPHRRRLEAQEQGAGGAVGVSAG